MTYDLFICLLAIGISSLVQCLFKYLTHFKIGFIFLMLSIKSSLYILDNSPLSDVCCKYFLPVFGPSSNFLDIVFCRAENFNFNDVQLISYFFHGLCFWCCIKKPSPCSRSPRFSHMLSFRSFLVLHITPMSLIHFELIFVKGIVCAQICFLWVFFAYWCSVVLVSFTKETLLHVLPLFLCQRLDYVYGDLFLGSIFYSNLVVPSFISTTLPWLL